MGGCLSHVSCEGGQECERRKPSFAMNVRKGLVKEICDTICDTTRRAFLLLVMSKPVEMDGLVSTYYFNKELIFRDGHDDPSPALVIVACRSVEGGW